MQQKELHTTKKKNNKQKTRMRMVQKTALYEKDDLMKGRTRNESRKHTQETYTSCPGQGPYT